MAWEPDYCTSTELKDYVRITDSVDDAQVALAITAASRAVDRATRRQFGSVSPAVARYYTARFDAHRLRWVVDIDDVMSTSGFAVAVDTDADGTFPDAIIDYQLAPRNAAADGRPWTLLVVGADSDVQPSTALVEGVRVTAPWGWTSVPTTVKQATLLQASRLLARRNSPYGIAGSPETGSELRLLARLDPDVELTVRTYRRAPWRFA